MMLAMSIVILFCVWQGYIIFSPEIASKEIALAIKQVYQLSVHFFIMFMLLRSASILAEQRTPMYFDLVFYSFLVLLAAFQLIWTARYVRRLAARPHPFLQ